MSLFGKKQKTGEKPNKTSKKSSKKSSKKNIKFPTPQDVKLFYVMPALFLIGSTTLVGSELMIHHNTSVYKARVMASSMATGSTLPSWGRQTDATLTMGTTRISPDGKDLAVEVKYDEKAHSSLTSFGNQYRLRLITPKDNPMKGVTMKYGLFGTDGSGVLTIHSPNGFANKAFVVMLIDGSKLVTSEDVNDSSGATSTTSDDDLDNSITAQLSNTNSDSSNSSDSDKTNLNMPPIYYMRLNAQNAKKSKTMWHNDRELVDELFVNDNIAKIKKTLKSTRNQVKVVQASLDEMNRRLKENPNDSIANDNKTSLQSKLDGLNQTLSDQTTQLHTLQDSVIKDNVLEPKQTKHDTINTSISSLQ